MGDFKAKSWNQECRCGVNVEIAEIKQITCGNMRQYAAICGNMRQYAAACGSMECVVTAICGNMRQYAAICGNMRQYGKCSRGSMRQYAAICGNIRKRAKICEEICESITTSQGAIAGCDWRARLGALQSHPVGGPSSTLHSHPKVRLEGPCEWTALLSHPPIAP